MWTTPIVLLCPALLTHTQNTEKRTARSLSVSPSVTQVRRFFPLTFRVSSASGLFFTLVCSTYLLTSRVLVNVGFVQTWCLVECDSRLCLSEIFFFFFKPSAGSNQFFLLHALSVWHFLAVFHKKKGSSGIKLYYKLISYTHTHIPGVKKKKITLIIKKLKVKKRKLCWDENSCSLHFTS